MTSKSLVPAAQATLPPPDRFPAYARAVAKIAPLSREEEASLVARWRTNQDPEAARTLVVGHLHLVVKQVRAHEGYGLAPEDLAQEGALGLMQAVHKFDARPNVRLGTYAWYWIEARIKEFILRNWRMVNLGVSSLAKKLFFGYRKTLAALSTEGVQAPSVNDLASAMDVSVEEARMARAYFMGGDVALFDEQDEDLEGHRNPMALLAADSEETPERVATSDRRLTQAQSLHTHLAVLPARQAQVLSERYLTEPARTLASIAEEWGVSIERVRQVEKQALVALRKVLPEPEE